MSQLDKLDFALVTKAGRYLILARNMSTIWWSRLFWNKARKQERICAVTYSQQFTKAFSKAYRRMLAAK